jgi:hypothetical protein
MKKHLIMAILLLSAFSLSAQKQSANDLLKEVGFSAENVLSCIDMSEASYSFTANSSTVTNQASNNSTTQTKKVYSFDSNKKLGERFTLISVDGDEPRKKDFKHFNKEKNSTEPNEAIKLKEEDFSIKSNDEEKAIIVFNIPAEQLNRQTAFMAHCTGYIYIDKKQGRITKIQIKSNEAFNLKIFHVTEMTININIAYNDEHKTYYVSNEQSNMKVLLLGSIVAFTIKEEYSDFIFN